MTSRLSSIHFDKVTNGTEMVMIDRMKERSEKSVCDPICGLGFGWENSEEFYENHQKRKPDFLLQPSTSPEIIVQAFHSSFSIILKEALQFFELYYRWPEKKPKLLLNCSETRRRVSKANIVVGLVDWLVERWWHLPEICVGRLSSDLAAGGSSRSLSDRWCDWGLWPRRRWTRRQQRRRRRDRFPCKSGGGGVEISRQNHLSSADL